MELGPAGWPLSGGAGGAVQSPTEQDQPPSPSQPFMLPLATITFWALIGLVVVWNLQIFF